MTDIATLKIEVKADGTAKVTGDLDRLTKSSKAAEHQAKTTSKTFTGMSGSLSKTAMTLAKLVGFTTVAAAIAGATAEAIRFETAMKEVSTLTNTMDMGVLTESVKELSAQFGANKISQAKALYQVISAGASTAAEATSTLAAANKLAIGGVTDVAIAADGLTSALNAYGLEATKAEDVSDMMFVAMKAGKTTIEELSSNIGKVAPVAAQAGVGLDELLSATAAITKTGLNTSMTMNSLRQAIVSILKPSQEASETAEALGIKFDSTALKSKGFTAMLEEIVQKTGGSTAIMTKLFGSVEALQSVMALTSESGGKDFLEILTGMEDRAGATQEAFGKMSKTTGFLAGVLREQLKNEILEIGTKIMTALNPALQWLTANFDSVKESATLLGQILLTGALAKGVTALPGMFGLVTGALKSTALALKGLAVAANLNPFMAIATAITIAATAIVLFRDETITLNKTTGTVGEYVVATWNWVKDKLGKIFGIITGTVEQIFINIPILVEQATNGMVKKFDLSWDNIKKATKTTINFIIGMIEMIGKSVGIIAAQMVQNFKNFGTAVLKIFTSTWEGIQRIFSGDFDFSELRQTLDEELVYPAENLRDSFKEAWESVSGRDYIGEVVDNLSEAGREISDNVKYTQDLNYALQEVVVTAKRWSPELSRTGMAAGNASTATAKLAAAMDDTAKKSDPFADALVHTVERIDTAFTDLWKSAFKGFDDFASSLKSAFQQLLAELAHLALTKPIIMNISAAMGLGASATANAAGSILGGSGGAGGLLNLLNGTSFGSLGIQGLTGLAGMLPAGSWAQTQLAGMTGGFGQLGYNTLSKFGIGGASAGTNFAVGAGLNAAAGFAGSWAGDKVFGDTTGAGSMLGSAAGAFLGMGNPLFTALGSFIGSGIEKGLSKLFGWGKGIGDDSARADINFATGEQNVYGVGKKFDQENLDAANTLTDFLTNFSDMVGGANTDLNIKVGSKTGVTIDGQKFKDDLDAAMEYALDTIVEHALGLDDALKDLILSFDGTAEEMVAFTQTIVAIDDMASSAEHLTDNVRDMIFAFEGTNEEMLGFAAAIIGLTDMMSVNPVESAVKDFAQATADASKTMTQAYGEQTFAAMAAINAFDGGADSAAKLAIEFGTMQQMAYQLAIAIKQASVAIGDMTSASAQQIRESVMSEDELRAARIAQRDQLAESLKTMVDPQEIAKTAAAIEQLNSQIFFSLSEEERAAQAETYAEYIENINNIAQSQLETALEKMEEQQNALNAGVEAMLNSAAAGQQSAANSMQRAANDFGTYVRQLITQGIPIDLNIASGGEVNA